MSQTIIGLAMNADDQASLHVVYGLFHRDSAVEYHAIFMEGFDIFHSWTLLYQFRNFNAAKVIHSCVFETIY